MTKQELLNEIRIVLISTGYGKSATDEFIKWILIKLEKLKQKEIEEKLKNLRLTFYISTIIKGNPAMEISDVGIGTLTSDSINKLKEIIK